MITYRFIVTKIQLLGIFLPFGAKAATSTLQKKKVSQTAGKLHNETTELPWQVPG